MHRLSLLFVVALAACPAESGTKAQAQDSKAAAADSKAAAPASADAKAKGPVADAKPAEKPAAAKDIDPKLLDPAAANETAPDSYKVKFTTTKGDFVVEVDRSLAPNGADRFYNLVKVGFYDDVAFFRAIDKFMVQFGLHGQGRVNATWRRARITDDPVKGTNKRGTITFATSGKDSRTTQVFINFKNNANLDKMGFSQFGSVVEGMDIVDSLHKGYGEGAPRGRGPEQGRIQREGNAYLKKEFPELDYVKSATIME